MEHEYTIVKTDGCVATDFEINGKSLYGEYNKISQEEEGAFTDYVINRLKEDILNGNISIDDLVNCFPHESNETIGDYCEQCGDTVTAITWKI